MSRPGNRSYDELREVNITRHFTKHAEGSVLVEYGRTQVICTASVEASVPRFLKGKGSGWITAEYGMLPRSTNTRMTREAESGKQGGRTIEIQRLIGRSLRAVTDLKSLGEYTIRIDCDVIQADGGTRTASITGGCVALIDALKTIKGNITPVLVASVSVGIIDGQPRLDLEYEEDSNAETDMNMVMIESGNFIEIQGTAERDAFSRSQLDKMMGLAEKGINELFILQRRALELT